MLPPLITSHQLGGWIGLKWLHLISKSGLSFSVQKKHNSNESCWAVLKYLFCYIFHRVTKALLLFSFCEFIGRNFVKLHLVVNFGNSYPTSAAFHSNQVCRSYLSVVNVFNVFMHVAFL